MTMESQGLGVRLVAPHPSAADTQGGLPGAWDREPGLSFPPGPGILEK